MASRMSKDAEQGAWRIVSTLFMVLCAIGVAMFEAQILVAWQGNSTEPSEAGASERQRAVAEEHGQRLPLPEVYSWDPRIFMVHGILSHEECDQLIEKSAKVLKKSATYHSDKSHRTSSSSFLGDPQFKSDTFIHEVKRRMLQALQHPSWHAENLQISRYEVGEQYKLHYDFSQPGAPKRSPDKFPAGDVLRTMTLILYLSDDFEGGETIFPHLADPNDSSRSGVGPIPESQLPKPGDKSWIYPDMAPYCKAGSGVLKLKPPKGSAVMFFDMTPDQRLDMKSLHGGCPVTKGTKYIAQQWINLNPAYVGWTLPYEHLTTKIQKKDKATNS